MYEQTEQQVDRNGIQGIQRTFSGEDLGGELRRIPYPHGGDTNSSLCMNHRMLPGRRSISRPLRHLHPVRHPLT
jgi:hypothetical protein